MLLRVDLEGAAYVAVVGFGGLTLTGPLRVAPGVAQETPHERFRLMEADEGLVMEAEVAGEWRALYRFDMQPQVLADYELANWFLCHYPESHFRAGLYAARVDGASRHALRGLELAHHRRGAPSERRALASADELRDVLSGVFGIRLPDAPELDALFERLAAPRNPPPSSK
jgi:N-hydroxyarylamine O-acetyltransferase